MNATQQPDGRSTNTAEAAQSTGLYQLVSGFEQIETSPDYYWNNRNRGPLEPTVWVCQLTLNGQAYYEDANGRQLVGVDRAMIFRHGEDSSYGYPDDATEPYRLRFVMISGGQSTQLFEWLRRRRGSVIHLPPGVPGRILFERLFARLDTAERNRFEESALVYRFIMELLAETPAPHGTADRLMLARDHIEDRFREPITVESIADDIGWSREHLARQYRKGFGRTISDDLRQRRLNEAHRLLCVSEEPVAEIALRCGYADVATFVRAFKRQFNSPPGLFRRSRLGV